MKAFVLEKVENIFGKEIFLVCAFSPPATFSEAFRSSKPLEKRKKIDTYDEVN